MTRWKAATIHLCLSIAVVALVALAVLSIWYLPALLPMSGIAGLIALIAIVDICIGPLLTLVVYAPGKPSLRFDLAVILVLQLGMLGYGLHILAQNRPVFIVGYDDRLVLVRASEITPEDLAAGPTAYRGLSWTGPVWVGARMPSDPQALSQLKEDSLYGRDIQMQPRFFLDFESVRPVLVTHGLPLEELLEHLTPQERRRLDRAQPEQAPERTRYLILNSSRGAALVLIEANGQLSAPIAIDPFDVDARRPVPAAPEDTLTTSFSASSNNRGSGPLAPEQASL